MKRPVRFNLAVVINAIALTGLLLIMVGLIWVMYHYTRPEPVDQAHVAERRKNLAELNAHAKDVLENYAWIDQARGLVQLPVARAMELAVGEWQNPAAGRSNLLWRLGQATPKLPQLQQTNSAPPGGRISTLPSKDAPLGSLSSIRWRRGPGRGGVLEQKSQSNPSPRPSPHSFVVGRGRWNWWYQDAPPFGPIKQ